MEDLPEDIEKILMEDEEVLYGTYGKSRIFLNNGYVLINKRIISFEMKPGLIWTKSNSVKTITDLR
jgi:hypothetical protein